jgi:hypothetical protein
VQGHPHPADPTESLVLGPTSPSPAEKRVDRCGSPGRRSPRRRYAQAEILGPSSEATDRTAAPARHAASVLLLLFGCSTRQQKIGGFGFGVGWRRSEFGLGFLGRAERCLPLRVSPSHSGPVHCRAASERRDVLPSFGCHGSRSPVWQRDWSMLPFQALFGFMGIKGV